MLIGSTHNEPVLASSRVIDTISARRNSQTSSIRVLAVIGRSANHRRRRQMILSNSGPVRRRGSSCRVWHRRRHRHCRRGGFHHSSATRIPDYFRREVGFHASTVYVYVKAGLATAKTGAAVLEEIRSAVVVRDHYGRFSLLLASGQRCGAFRHFEALLVQRVVAVSVVY